MALSMLVALTTCPAMLATSEAISQGQKKERREVHRARRCNMIVTCLKQSRHSRRLDHRPVVLKDGRLVINTSKGDGDDIANHSYTGYFLPYPETSYEGLVTSVSDEPPVMNWIYVDKDTCEVKYGVRVDAQGQITGPFDCTRQDRRLTLDGWEGFVAVEKNDGEWGLYFDKDDNGLREKVPSTTRVLEVELWRVEKRRKRGEDAS